MKRIVLVGLLIFGLVSNVFAAGWDSTTNMQLITVSAAFTQVQNCLKSIDGSSEDYYPTNIVAKNLKLKGATSGTTTITPAAVAGATSVTLPAANSVTLPSGAIFYMVTGSCPAGTTDVTATYSNKFVRINATGGSTGGADTHSHTLSVANLAAHTHNINTEAGFNVGSSISSGNTQNTTVVATASAGSGTAFTGDNVPAYVTAKCCQVN